MLFYYVGGRVSVVQGFEARKDIMSLIPQQFEAKNGFSLTGEVLYI
jgi:hypothetical protein